MKKIISILAVLLLVIVNSGFQIPGRFIQGKVISFSESFPLEGVTVQVKGTKNISGTQPDGIFSISIEPGDTVMVFSLPGYQTEEVKIVRGKNDYDIVLKSL